MKIKQEVRKFFENPNILTMAPQELDIDSIVTAIDCIDFYDGEMFFMLGPRQWLSLFKIENFLKESIVISNTERMWLGIRWVLNNNLPMIDEYTRKAVYFKQSAITLGKNDKDYEWLIQDKDNVLFVNFEEK